MTVPHSFHLTQQHSTANSLCIRHRGRNQTTNTTLFQSKTQIQKEGERKRESNKLKLQYNVIASIIKHITERVSKLDVLLEKAVL